MSNCEVKSGVVAASRARFWGVSLGLSLCLSLGLVACAPTVKLDEPAPVVDAKPLPVNTAQPPATSAVGTGSPAGSGATATPTDNRNVTPVNAAAVVEEVRWR